MKVWLVIHRKDRNEKGVIIMVPDKIFKIKEDAYDFANQRTDEDISEIYEMKLE